MAGGVKHRPASPMETGAFFALDESARTEMLERYRQEYAEWKLYEAALTLVDDHAPGSSAWCPQCCVFVEFFDVDDVCPVCEATVWWVR